MALLVLLAAPGLLRLELRTDGHALIPPRDPAIAYDAEQNRFFLGHGNKSNIVRRNGMPVLSTEEIVNGDTIRIGKTSLRFVALCGPDFRWDHGGEAHGNADV